MNHPAITKSSDALAFDEDIPDEGEGHGWIQWKGTDVCMDLHCRCGAHGHLDCMFAYNYRCAVCGDTFVVGSTVRLYPIAVSLVDEIAGDRAKTDPDASVE